MASTSETGHAKNVAKLQDLISFVIVYGAIYNPSKNTLKLPQLTALATAAQACLVNLITNNTIYNNLVNERVIAFKDLKSLSTRLINALQTTDASPEKVKNAIAFNKKIQGVKAIAKTTARTTSADPNAPAAITISTAQQSYSQLIQHLAGLIAILESEISYTPNEIELQIVTLKAKLADLTHKNNSVATAYANFSNSRIERNNILYGTDTGLVDIATEVKKYIKSLFGATSPQYAQIKGIIFTRLKK